VFGATLTGFLVFVVVALPVYAALLYRLRGRLHLDAFVRSLRDGGDG
jgi:hypothetical protein